MLQFFTLHMCQTFWVHRCRPSAHPSLHVSRGKVINCLHRVTLFWFPVSSDWHTGPCSETNLGSRRPRPHQVTGAAAAAARRTQSCAKLICLSSRLRAAEADRGGIIELGFFFFFLLLLLLTGMEAGFHSPFFSSPLCCLSAFRWRRHADNWMKNSSCVGGGLCVRACACTPCVVWSLAPFCEE